MAKTKAKQSPLVKIPFWQDDRKMGWLFAGFAFLLYAQTIGFDYALDDIAVTWQNDFVKAGFSGIGKILHTFYWAGFPNFASANSGLFRPVSLILFAIEWQFVPNSPHFYHFINLALFAVCVYQLYRLLRELLGKDALMLSIITTLIWVALPVHTEVNANIKSADEILSFLFFVLSFRKLLEWNEKKNTGALIISVVFIFLSLLSKEGAILFIPVMLLALIMFRKKSVKEVLLPAGIFAVAAFIWLGWHYWVISNGPPRVTYDYRDNALLSSTSSIDRIGTAIGMQSRYWLKMLIGYPLSYNYSYNEIPVDGFASVWAWISLAGIAAAGYFSWKNFRSNPVVSYAILFYFITFALTCNIFYLIGETFAERLVFVPSLGFALLFAWIILKLTKGTTEKKIHAPAMYLLTGILLVYSIRTYSRSQDWKYQNDLFTADVENAPNSARVHDNYGLLLLGNADKEKDQLASQKLKDAAYAQFSTAAAIDTLDFQAALLLAQLNLAKMNYDSAIYWGKKDIHIFRSYYKVNPNDPAIYSILGNAWIFIHKPDSAAVYFNEGLKIFPQNENFMIDIGNSYFARQDTVNALVYYQKAVDANPKSITAWDKVGNVAGMHREYERSNKAFETLLQLNPSDPKPYATMRTNYLLLGDTAKAIQYNQLYIDHGGK
jgi:tetratricopeptide (TPR) repeat protein